MVYPKNVYFFLPILRKMLRIGFHKFKVFKKQTAYLVFCRCVCVCTYKEIDPVNSRCMIHVLKIRYYILAGPVAHRERQMNGSKVTHQSLTVIKLSRKWGFYSPKFHLTPTFKPLLPTLLSSFHLWEISRVVMMIAKL